MKAREKKARTNVPKAKTQHQNSKAVSRKRFIKTRSIGTTLIIGYMIPVLLMIVLGVISYTSASSTITKKYEESSVNTITAMSMYGRTLADGVISRSLEQVNNVDAKEYYEKFADNTDPAWIQHYSNTKGKLQQMFNNTTYLSNYYIIPKKGTEINTLSKDLGSEMYDRFMKSSIGSEFAADISKKNGWYGEHIEIDEVRGSDGTDYAFTYVQKFLRADAFLILDWSMESVEEIISKINFGNGSISALVSADGREIARIRKVDEDGTDIIEKVDGTVFVDKDFYLSSKEQEDVICNYVTWNNESYLYVYASLGLSLIHI